MTQDNTTKRHFIGNRTNRPQEITHQNSALVQTTKQLLGFKPGFVGAKPQP